VVSTIAPDDAAYLSRLVREHDRPRYYATLFAPGELRDDLIALYGFAAELARVPNLVSEPQLGEVRLRWWHDSLSAATETAGAGQTPALRALSATIAKHRLPVAPLEALIEARSADLYADPPANLTELEGRLGETESSLFQMAAIIAGAEGPEVAEAAGHAGVAYGLARRLAVTGPDRARGRTFLPADVLGSSGISAHDVFAATPQPELSNALGRTVAIARRHLRESQQRVSALRRSVRSPFLPLAVVAPLLRRIERAGADIWVHEARLSDLESLMRIGLARLR
jgi:phytoene synthase